MTTTGLVEARAPTAHPAPPIRFDPAQVGADCIADAWQALARGFYDNLLLGPEARFDAAVSACWVDDLLLSHVRYRVGDIWCEPDRVGCGESDVVTIRWYAAGSRPAPADEPDQICVRDVTVPGRGRSEDSQVWGLAIPRARVADAELLRSPAPMVVVPVGSPSGLMLTAALRAACAAVERAPGSGSELASALVGLVNGMLEPAARGLRDDARLAAMKTYLRRRLADPTLSGADLQKHFHYSRATVYRLFEPDGGVAHFIRDERLRRCHDDIAHPDRGGDRTTVSGVAARWGYADPAQFGRAFRRRYGRPPRDVLRAARAGQPPQMSSTNRPSARSSASHS